MRTLFIFLVALLAAGQQPAAVEKFADRLENYLKLRKSACESLPKLDKKAEPEDIVAHKRAAAQAIQTARAGASQGEIFTPAVAAHLKSVIREYMTGIDARPAKKTANQGNPAQEGDATVPLKVNATYPDSAPLSTVPPGLLLKLPELPKELDYRFVGRHLVLHDAQAGIIVDFVRNALP